MAAYHSPEIETNVAENGKRADAWLRNLGLGLDVTNNDPWENKTSIEVRRNATPNDILVVPGPNIVDNYSCSVVHSKDLIFNAGAHAGALQETVEVGLDTGFSRKRTESQHVVGIRVHTRTVSFKVIPGDTTETSFEEDLRNAIKFDSIEEGEFYTQSLVDACKDYVKKYNITHYSTAIKLGAMRSQVVHLNRQTSRFRFGFNATTAVALAPPAPTVAAHVGQQYTSTKFSKVSQLKEIGKLADDHTVTSEGVIGIIIAPIHGLVKTPKLAEALHQAVGTYCSKRLQKPAGPFFIVCRSADDPLYLKENKAEQIIEGTN